MKVHQIDIDGWLGFAVNVAHRVVSCDYVLCVFVLMFSLKKNDFTKTECCIYTGTDSCVLVLKMPKDNRMIKIAIVIVVSHLLNTINEYYKNLKQ